MCSLENAIETMEKSVFISHKLFKILLDNYRIDHTDNEVQLLLDNDDTGLATNGEIEILLHGLRDENEQLVKDKDRLKEEILALKGSANAFQISKCESCQESQRADKELDELDKLVDKYNDLAHRHNDLADKFTKLESSMPSHIKVHHFPEELPVIPAGEPCVGLYLLSEDKPLKNVNDHSTLYNFEIEGAFRKGNKPCYFIYTKDVLDALNKAALSTPEPCNTFEDVVMREG